MEQIEKLIIQPRACNTLRLSYFSCSLGMLWSKTTVLKRPPSQCTKILSASSSKFSCGQFWPGGLLLKSCKFWANSWDSDRVKFWKGQQIWMADTGMLSMTKVMHWPSHLFLLGSILIICRVYCKKSSLENIERMEWLQNIASTSWHYFVESSINEIPCHQGNKTILICLESRFCLTFVVFSTLCILHLSCIYCYFDLIKMVIWQIFSFALHFGKKYPSVS